MTNKNNLWKILYSIFKYVIEKINFKTSFEKICKNRKFEKETILNIFISSLENVKISENINLLNFLF